MMKTITLTFSLWLSLCLNATATISAMVFTDDSPENLLNFYERLTEQEVVRTPSLDNAHGLISFSSRGELNRRETAEIVVSILERKAGILLEFTPHGYVRAVYDPELTLKSKSNEVRRILGELRLLERLMVTSDGKEIATWVKSDLAGIDWVIYVPDDEILPQIQGEVDRESYNRLKDHLCRVMDDEDVKVILAEIDIIED